MKRIGLGVTGSFCTFSNLLTALDDLTANGYDVTPVFSYNTANWTHASSKRRIFTQK